MVVPSSLISITIAPEVTTVAPERVVVVVEVEVEETVTVDLLALLLVELLAKLES